ncbi:Biopolymer transport protein ExbD/TolR [Flavobacterium sp. CF108]|uniref:ExbD/TolR family protein n=1 Tax=unclassified Flavobacterium TaxID=196869 RepID=UPI0008B24FF2|nr:MULTISPECIES: biopolymer transporter ExbD [unclassified Flavobacterium]SEO29417.1 Biopolymer transport protein ExbD/TolR [Flavobacterium sp. fv08]SHG43380.1 Biopolymer transport protein ExbD/TolR [Flavobacterium sp. CF108]
MKNLPQKVRSKKLSSRVDLTAMVSVSFLLIIFFMLVGELSKPKVMDLGNEREGCGSIVECNKPDENRIMTIILGDNNKLITYSGLLSAPIETPKEVEYGKNGIREELIRRNRMVLEYSANLGKYERGVQVVIKPSKKCNYGNLVDILDEMRITGINSYAIVDYYTPEEENLLAIK